MSYLFSSFIHEMYFYLIHKQKGWEKWVYSFQLVNYLFFSLTGSLLNSRNLFMMYFLKYNTLPSACIFMHFGFTYFPVVISTVKIFSNTSSVAMVRVIRSIDSRLFRIKFYLKIFYDFEVFQELSLTFYNISFLVLRIFILTFIT